MSSVAEMQTSPEDRARAVAESGWGYPVRFLQWGNPAFWVYVLLVGSGAITFYGKVKDSLNYPTATVLSLLFIALYGLPFVWFLTRRDRYEREPAKLALLGFLWGGLAASWVMAAPGNSALISVFAKVFGTNFALDWGPAISAPLTEETAKWSGLILLFLLARNHVRSAYDGLILGAFSGLGFQLFENFQYLLNAVSANYGSHEVLDLFPVLGMRAVTGLWGHWLFSAIAGTGLGYFIGATNRSMAHRLAVAAGFMLWAMVAHGAMDAVLAIGPIALLLNILLTIAGIIFAWRFADRRQRTWMTVLLEDDVARGTVSADEAEVLAGPRKARKRYLKALRDDKGQSAAKHARFVLDAETDLAAQIAATNNPASPEATAARAELARVRALAVA